MSSRKGPNPNPLLIKWVSEWRDSAKQANSKMEFVYGKALKSLRDHKEPLENSAQCKKLKGFGDKICAQLEKKFIEHYGAKYAPTIVSMSPVPKSKNSKKNCDKQRPISPSITTMFPIRKRVCDSPLHHQLDPTSSPRPSSPVRKKASRPYIPAQGSSGFAILVALLYYELEESIDQVNKLDLQDMAQRYTTTILSTTTANQRYSGWNTIKTLISKELVAKTDGRNSYYFLTDEGRKLARNLASVCPSLQELVKKFPQPNSEDTQSTNPIEFNLNSNEEPQVTVSDSQVSSQSSSGTSRVMAFVLEPDTYEIILCVDTRERIATNFCKENRAAFAAALQKQDVRVETRTLPLGDFVWIAREKCKSNQPGDIVRFNSMQPSATSEVRRELVLDVIVERKRIDDLASSIKDRRWDEQKFRLRNCGLRKPTYLVEYMGKGSKRAEFGGLKADALEQAMTNAEIDGFDVKRSDSFEETVRYLTFMTRWLERQYRNRTIMSCPNKQLLSQTDANDYQYITFNEFAVNSAKIQTFTAKEMFVKHLLQIKGCSMSKAASIVELYPTLSSLINQYESKEDRISKHNLLSNLRADAVVGSNRRLGPALSRKICQFYARC